MALPVARSLILTMFRCEGSSNPKGHDGPEVLAGRNICGGARHNFLTSAYSSIQLDNYLQDYTRWYTAERFPMISLEEKSSLFICFSHANTELRNPDPNSHAPCYMKCCREGRREKIGNRALQAINNSIKDFPTMYSTHIGSVIEL